MRGTEAEETRGTEGATSIITREAKAEEPSRKGANHQDQHKGKQGRPQGKEDASHQCQHTMNRGKGIEEQKGANRINTRGTNTEEP